jgi:hypothetical protein
MASKEKAPVGPDMGKAPDPDVPTCKHCGRGLKVGANLAGMLHDNDLMRCLPWESKQPYGLVAEMDE